MDFRFIRKVPDLFRRLRVYLEGFGAEVLEGDDLVLNTVDQFQT